MICGQTQDSITLLTSIPCTGFQSTPALEFSKNDPQHAKAFIDRDNSVLISLIQPSILNFFADNPVKWLSCGFEHVVVCLENGKLATWGYGASGCLGTGNLNSYAFPQLLHHREIQNRKFVFVEAGGYHSAAISDHGEIYTWGRSDVGQLGHP